MYRSEGPGHSYRWNKRTCGVICFVKDNLKRSYYIRVFDMDRQALVFDQEIYNQFKYKSPRPYFHTFEGDDAQIGLNFADEGEADIFRQTVWPHNSSSQASNFHHRLSRSCWKENKGERRDRHTKSSSSSKVLSFVTLSSLSDIVLWSQQGPFICHFLPYLWYCLLLGLFPFSSLALLHFLHQSYFRQWFKCSTTSVLERPGRRLHIAVKHS